MASNPSEGKMKEQTAKQKHHQSSKTVEVRMDTLRVTMVIRRRSLIKINVIIRGGGPLTLSPAL